MRAGRVDESETRSWEAKKSSVTCWQHKSRPVQVKDKGKSPGQDILDLISVGLDQIPKGDGRCRWSFRRVVVVCQSLAVQASSIQAWSGSKCGHQALLCSVPLCLCFCVSVLQGSRMTMRMRTMGVWVPVRGKSGKRVKEGGGGREGGRSKRRRNKRTKRRRKRKRKQKEG